MPWLCWEILFSMLCMLCTNNGSSLNLDLMISGNYVVIMSVSIYIYVYMYVCRYVIFSRHHDCFVIMLYMYLCHCL